MSGWEIAQAIATAVSLAIILGGARLFQRVSTLETQTKPLLDEHREMVELRAAVKPLLAWYERVALDSLKIATNPTSERLTWLADRYIAYVRGSGSISTDEKQELIDGLRDLLHDKSAEKRQSASVSLRFIEQREGLTAQKPTNH